MDEIHQTLTTWVNQVVRINKEDNYVEFDWIVGPIPTEYVIYISIKYFNFKH